MSATGSAAKLAAEKAAARAAKKQILKDNMKLLGGVDNRTARFKAAKMARTTMGRNSGHMYVGNKAARNVINSGPGRFMRRHPVMLGAGVLGATGMSRGAGPTGAGSPRGNSNQARGIYGF